MERIRTGYAALARTYTRPSFAVCLALGLIIFLVRVVVDWVMDDPVTQVSVAEGLLTAVASAAALYWVLNRWSLRARNDGR